MLPLTVKLAVSALILGGLVLAHDAGDLGQQLNTIDLSLFALATLSYMPVTFIQSERLRLIAKGKAPLAFYPALSITWIGIFFSQVLPTSLGGDPFRVWYLHKQGLDVAASTNITLADRIVGLATIFLLTGLAAPWLLFATGNLPAFTLSVVFSGAGLAALALLVNLDRLTPLLPQRFRDTALIGYVRAASPFLRSIVLSRHIAPPALALSILGQLLQVCMVWLLARSVDIELSPFSILAFMQLSNIAAILPISVAGWGIREVVLIAAFSLIGAASGGIILVSVLTGLSTLLISLPGLGFWLAAKPGKPAEDRGTQTS